MLVVLAGWQGAHGCNLRRVDAEAVAGGFEREEAAREEAAHGASVLAVVDGEIVVRRAARAALYGIPTNRNSVMLRKLPTGPLVGMRRCVTIITETSPA